jgi:hypothetical protein
MPSNSASHRALSIPTPKMMQLPLLLALATTAFSQDAQDSTESVPVPQPLTNRTNCKLSRLGDCVLNSDDYVACLTSAASALATETAASLDYSSALSDFSSVTDWLTSYGITVSDLLDVPTFMGSVPIPTETDAHSDESGKEESTSEGYGSEGYGTDEYTSTMEEVTMSEDSAYPTATEIETEDSTSTEESVETLVESSGKSMTPFPFVSFKPYAQADMKKGSAKSHSRTTSTSVGSVTASKTSASVSAATSASGTANIAGFTCFGMNEGQVLALGLAAVVWFKWAPCFW